MRSELRAQLVDAGWGLTHGGGSSFDWPSGFGLAITLDETPSVSPWISVDQAADRVEYIVRTPPCEMPPCGSARRTRSHDFVRVRGGLTWSVPASLAGRLRFGAGASYLRLIEASSAPGTGFGIHLQISYGRELRERLEPMARLIVETFAGLPTEGARDYGAIAQLQVGLAVRLSG